MKYDPTKRLKGNTDEEMLEQLEMDINDRRQPTKLKKEKPQRWDEGVRRHQPRGLPPVEEA